MTRDAVTELVRENAALSTRNRELARALAQVEAVSQLTAGVVHDLRNAFHLMLMAAEGLRNGAHDSTQHELAVAVITAGNQAAEMARDLLAFARKQDARSSVVDCQPFFQEFRRLVERILLKGITFELTVEPGVTALQADRQQLSAALLNLCVNARDAMPRGGTLRITARNIFEHGSRTAELPPGDYVELVVADSGSGMTPEVIARATEAFYTTKAGSGGTGLGLAMVQSFATRSGGALWIESELGRGTKVHLYLPRAPHRERNRDDERLERIQSRIRTPWLRAALQEWRAACPETGLPRPIAAEAGLIEHADWSLVLGVDRNATPPALRLIRMGAALTSALGNTALGEISLHGSLVLGRLSAAYRRALRSRAPSYEYARFAFGGNAPVEFERLILPAAVDGETVSHLIGIVQLPRGTTNGKDIHHRLPYRHAPRRPHRP